MPSNFRFVKYNVFLFTYTRRNLFEILFDQTEIRLCLPFYGGFRTKRNSVSFMRTHREFFFWIMFSKQILDCSYTFSICILLLYVAINMLLIVFKTLCLMTEVIIVFIMLLTIISIYYYSLLHLILNRNDFILEIFFKFIHWKK